MRTRDMRIFAICLMLVSALFLISCAGSFSSSPRGGERGSGRIPQPGSRGAGEPSITLYNKDTEKTEKMKIEKYLQGVVAGEMDPNWPEEALAAQAIIARTFTLKKILEGGVKEHKTDASTDEKEFQAYNASEVNDKVRKAVDKTRGVVATYNGQYINGWFHADAGGKTAASALEGLEYKQEKHHIVSVTDPGYERAPENKSWRAEFPISVVRQKVQNWAGKDPGDISQVDIIEKGPSGRITKVKLGDMTMSGPALRLALGSEDMRSTLVSTLKIENNNLVVEGRGFGHGVGMSQWGAKAMADQGKTAKDIVNYFYKDIMIEKIWK